VNTDDDQNKSVGKQNTGASPDRQIDSEMLAKLSDLRAQVREKFGNVTMAMIVLPRYRNQTIADLHHLVLEPLMRDKLALAYPSNAEKALLDVSGMAIWASVSEEVDLKIRDQIKAGAFRCASRRMTGTRGPSTGCLM